MNLERIIFIFIFLFITQLPLVKSNMAIMPLSSSSLPEPGKYMNIELVDAQVNISCYGSSYITQEGSLDFIGKIISHENISKYATIDILAEPLFYEKTRITVNGGKIFPGHSIINGTKYFSFNYKLTPEIETIIKINSDIKLPFYYYLTSLVSYSKVKHEKITIKGPCIAKFNDFYPFKRIDQDNGCNTWEWEYYNINTTDSNVLGTIEITRSNEPGKCTYNYTDECCPYNCNACNDVDCFKTDLSSDGRIETYRKNYCPTTTSTSTTTTSATTTTIQKIIEKPQKSNFLIRIYQKIKNFFQDILKKT